MLNIKIGTVVVVVVKYDSIQREHKCQLITSKYYQPTILLNQICVLLTDKNECVQIQTYYIFWQMNFQTSNSKIAVCNINVKNITFNDKKSLSPKTTPKNHNKNKNNKYLQTIVFYLFQNRVSSVCTMVHNRIRSTKWNRSARGQFINFHTETSKIAYDNL